VNRSLDGFRHENGLLGLVLPVRKQLDEAPGSSLIWAWMTECASKDLAPAIPKTLQGRLTVDLLS